MSEKRGKSKERMQTQAKPSNRAYERNMPKTTDNVYEKDKSIEIKKDK